MSRLASNRLFFDRASRLQALRVVPRHSAAAFDHRRCRPRRHGERSFTECHQPSKELLLLDSWYRGSVARGILQEDMAQVQACHRLQKLQKLLHGYGNWNVRLWRKQEDLERKRLAELEAQQRKEGQETKTDVIDDDSTLWEGHGILEAEGDGDKLEKLTESTEPLETVGKPGHDRSSNSLDTEDRRHPERVQSVSTSLGVSSADENFHDANEKTIDPSTSVATSNTMVRTQIPRGFYLHGEVGTGKSVILQAFYHNAAVAQKQRFHMHAFLADIHQRLLRLRNPRNPKAIAVAREYARECSLLYIDEFQLTDVADTVLVYQVLAEVARLGTVLVMTSNRSPQGLVETGQFHIQPVVELIRKFCIVHEIKSTTDYRQQMHQEPAVAGFDTTKVPNTYFVTDGKSESRRRKDVENVLRRLVGTATNGVGRQLPLASAQRHVTMTVHERRSISVGVCNFANLCIDNRLGVADFRALAEQLDVLVLYDIPPLSDASMAEADTSRRFITLIDQLYEWRRPVMCTAPVPPRDLFTSVFQETVLGDVTAPPITIRTGVDDIRFAFPRAASRLMEMTSPSWWRSVYDYCDGADVDASQQT